MAEYGTMITGPAEAVVGDAEASGLVVEMGKVYWAEMIVEGRLKEGPEAVAEAVASVRRQYPGIMVNYVKVEPAGEGSYRVVVQFFDPRPAGLFPAAVVAVIVVLGLIVAALFLTYKIIKLVVRIINAAARKVEEAIERVAAGRIGPAALSPLEAALAAAAVGGVAGYVLGGKR